MKQIKTALFVDFDNIFSSLYDDDPDMAIVMATNPSQWLEILKKHSLPEGDERDFLVRRVYLNAAGGFRDTIWGDNKSGWLSFKDYRKCLTNAGVEVVDCPSLTQYGKSAADTRMIIDVLNSLDATARYDDCIIVSGDADFSSLCHDLRSKDRRVTIISSGWTSAAYRNIAHSHLDMATIIDKEKVKKQRSKTKRKVWKEAKRYINNSNAPLPLESLRTELTVQFGEKIIDKVDESGWFGEGSFSGFVRLMGGKDGIHVHGEDVRKADKHGELEKAVIDEEAKEVLGNADKHDEPEKTIIDEEYAKEVRDVTKDYVWDVAKSYIDNSNDPLSLRYLGARLQSEFYLTIEKTNWFGEGSFSGFVRLMGGKDGIHVHGEDVRKADKHGELEKAIIDEEAKEVWGNADKHDEPKKAIIDEEAEKEVWHWTKDYINNSNVPVLLGVLGARLRSEFGETIDKSNWFGRGSLTRFVHFRGDEYDILMNDQYVWNADKHDDPEKAFLDEEEAKKCWDVAKDYIDNSNEPVLLGVLGARLRSEFGETIDKSNWFGRGSLSRFVHFRGGEDDILMNDQYVWNADKHDDPEKAFLDEEEAKKCWDVAKDYIDNSNEPVLLADLDARLRSEFGETIDKSNWFGRGSLSRFVHFRGDEDDILMNDQYVWNADKHDDPEKAFLDEEEAKKCWDVAKDYIDNSNEPLLLSNLANILRSEFGETIDKSEWFGMASLRRFVHFRGDEVGILMNEQYVWNADKHDDPEKAFLDEEEAKKCWDVAKDYIDNSNEPLLLSNLANILRSEFGETIDKSEWFGMASLRRFVHFRGDEVGILMNEQYVWNADKHDDPEKAFLDEEEAKKCWDVAKDYIDNSNEPVLLSNLANILRSEFGEIIDKSEWFGMASLRRFVHFRGDEVGILMNEQYVWNADKHDDPEKAFLDEEEAKKCWDVAKDYIDNSNEPVLLSNLTNILRSEFGETIDKSEWFGMASLRRFVHFRGDEVGILMNEQYVWNADKHDDPEKAFLDEEQAKKCWDVAKDYIDNSNEPVLLAELGARLRSEFGETIDKSEWFGMVSLGRFVRSMGAEDDILMNDQHVWNADKHDEPIVPKIPVFIEQFCQLANLPRLNSEEWKATIVKLAIYAAETEFNRTESSKWTRDRLTEDGFNVSRNAVIYLVRRALRGGCRPLRSNPPPTAEEIREGFIQNIIQHHRILPLNLSDDDDTQTRLNAWLDGKGEPGERT